jgi:hypothetical protein
MLFQKLEGKAGGGGHWTQSYFQFVLQGKLFATICSVVEHVLGTCLSGYYLMLLQRTHSCVLLTHMFTVVVICSFALQPPPLRHPCDARCVVPWKLHQRLSLLTPLPQAHQWPHTAMQKIREICKCHQHSTHEFWAVLSATNITLMN